jgi:flagellar biosynthesis protein FlhB
MSEQDQEKTELPTPKRREEARRKGQVPRSQELNTAAIIFASGLGLYFFGHSMAIDLAQLMQGSLSFNRAQALDEALATTHLASIARQALLLCAPIFMLTFIVALAAPLCIGGWNLSASALRFDPARLSPLAGLQRIFSVRSVVELIKAFAKFALVALFAVMFLSSKIPELLVLGSESTVTAVAHAAKLSGEALLLLATALVLIAAIDVPFQLYQYTKQLKMSRQEVREELKESEGSPETRGRIRNLQQEMAGRRMMQEVPKADVIVVNPTHYAVALRYDDKRMRAPILVAKGTDAIAAKIREVGTENDVPIFEAPPLARALHRHVDIGTPIPASLYVAVAQVLTYIYQLRHARSLGGTPPTPPIIDAVDP